MKISIEVKPGTAKRVLTIAGGLALIIGVVAVARAVPITFNNGEVLTAEQLNMNFTNLESRLAAVEAIPHVKVATGVHTGTFTDGTWNLHTGGGGRNAAYPVVFATPFASTPTVTLGINYVEATATDLRLGVSVSAVTTTGFTINYGTYSDTLVNAASVSWHAYTP
jgi:hypothetical protein